MIVGFVQNDMSFSLKYCSSIKATSTRLRLQEADNINSIQLCWWCYYTGNLVQGISFL